MTRYSPFVYFTLALDLAILVLVVYIAIRVSI